ncbi:MAG TPA: EexN family lipoprotein [Povalibacter sp.]|uniref:EexN family lipoprotein n=1 Tax=Povalibacter sp. TaxID=1962978 RepID=UPI002C028B94|nr:EexN family lipoprotein [Povalibacter sp.]HMN43829.1 EexN family lipoprotein [Povalibacter sp.]
MMSLHMSRLLVSVLAVLMLVACSRKPSEYTVGYYKAHKEERTEKLRECADDPGALRDDPLCINAKQADRDEAIGSLRDLPPVGLLDDLKDEKKD